MRTISVLLFLGVSVVTTQAAVVVPTITPVTGGFSYDYTVTNTGDTGIIQFQVTLSSGPTSIGTPLDWISTSFASGANTVVQWVSVTSEIPAGADLAGFVIVSALDPVSITFKVTDMDFNIASGTTSGPSVAAVPEPGTLSLAIAAVLAAGVLGRRHSILVSTQR
jgi:hypothetical protein